MKKIALVGHSSRHGGAETAFLNQLKSILGAGHSAVAVFPDASGPLFKEAIRLGAEAHVCRMTRMLGDPVTACQELSAGSAEQIKSLFESRGVDLVITNTLSVFEGAVAAADLKLPHVWSVHEIADTSPEYMLGATSPGTFVNWAADLSDAMLFCSGSAKDAAAAGLSERVAAEVLWPFVAWQSPYQTNGRRDARGVINLYFVGSPTRRKNPLHAVEVLRALVMRGHDARLVFVGGMDDETGLLDRTIRRRGLTRRVQFIGYVSDPYRYFAGRAVNLICSECEPFGLSMPECESRGIPVVAPGAYGPAEYLSRSSLYKPNDVVSCVRTIERVVSDYPTASEQAQTNYRRCEERFAPGYHAEKIRQLIDTALRDVRAKSLPKELGRGFWKEVLHSRIVTYSAIVESIARVTALPADEVEKLIQGEKQSLGKNVAADVKGYGVVPFHHSPEMDRLYAEGKGFAIELASTFQDFARIRVAGFILLRLLCEQRNSGKKLRLLAVGDGIGVDSIRLASAGFDVDYIDVDSSVTSRVAAENFRKFNDARFEGSGRINVVGMEHAISSRYDALICLEVIEHVGEPMQFLAFLADRLVDGGIAFVSDCFPCLQDHYPTHLATNEQWAGLLPVMASVHGLTLEGYSRAPLYKPFVFVKRSENGSAAVDKTLSSAAVRSIVVSAQVGLVSVRRDRIDELAAWARLATRRALQRYHRYRLRAS